MKNYSERYEEFTRATVKIAKRIHNANKSNFANVKYSLPQVTTALRNIYKDPIFHKKFVGGNMEDNKWSSGFCAMASVIVYEMFGGANVWNMMAIRYNDWGISSVVFLRDKATGLDYATTGEHFSMVVPYDIGKPLDINKLNTPNKDVFKNALMFELKRLYGNNDK